MWCGGGGPFMYWGGPWGFGGWPPCCGGGGPCIGMWPPCPPCGWGGPWPGAIWGGPCGGPGGGGWYGLCGDGEGAGLCDGGPIGLGACGGGIGLLTGDGLAISTTESTLPQKFTKTFHRLHNFLLGQTKKSFLSLQRGSHQLRKENGCRRGKLKNTFNPPAFTRFHLCPPTKRSPNSPAQFGHEFAPVFTLLCWKIPEISPAYKNPSASKSDTAEE
uniref:(northern house mosquito) hypothetical protein n=1 Tax=Culex pipiens TaxID=7175 RepID=A0A8D8DB36_CULPI